MNALTLDLSALQNALTSLEDGLDVVNDYDWFNAQRIAVQNTLLAGVIQNFEFVYEISVKMIKRSLELGSASSEEIDGLDFRDLMRLAAERGLINDIEAWFNYRKLRNITAHTYDHEKARQVYQATKAFLGHARALLLKLESRHG